MSSYFLFGIILLSILMFGSSKQFATHSSLEDDLSLLLQYFPGEYDNYAQWESDVEQNVSAGKDWWVVLVNPASQCFVGLFVFGI